MSQPANKKALQSFFAKPAAKKPATKAAAEVAEPAAASSAAGPADGVAASLAASGWADAAVAPARLDIKLDMGVKIDDGDEAAAAAAAKEASLNLEAEAARAAFWAARSKAAAEVAAKPTPAAVPAPAAAAVAPAPAAAAPAAGGSGYVPPHQRRAGGAAAGPAGPSLSGAPLKKDDFPTLGGTAADIAAERKAQLAKTAWGVVKTVESPLLATTAAAAPAGGEEAAEAEAAAAPAPPPAPVSYSVHAGEGDLLASRGRIMEATKEAVAANVAAADVDAAVDRLCRFNTGPLSRRSYVVEQLVLTGLDAESASARKFAADILSRVVSGGVASRADAAGGVKAVLAQRDDLAVDIPKIDAYLAELLGGAVIKPGVEAASVPACYVAAADLHAKTLAAMGLSLE